MAGEEGEKMSGNSFIPKRLSGLEFTLAMGCKVACHYCPQKMLITAYNHKFPNANKYMTFDDFKIILSKLTPECGIGWCGMSEPFQNPECAKMIKYAWEKGHKISLSTTLEGATWDDIRMIENVDFVSLVLHIPDSAMNSKFSLSNEWLEIFDYVNHNFSNIGYSCHGETHEIMKNRIILGRVYQNSMHNRAGNLEYEELPTKNVSGKKACFFGDINGNVYGWSPTVLPNGAVVVCCNDYGLKHVLGNIIDQDWDEIFRGSEWKNIVDGWEGKNDTTLCYGCQSVCQPNDTVITNSCMMKDNVIRTAMMMEQNDLRIREIKDQLLQHDNIVIWGLGKLFTDSYFECGWSDLIQARYFVDSNAKARQKILDKGMDGVISPEEICKIENPLVITYVSNDAAIRTQLKTMNINDVINIFDIYKASFKEDKRG